jgi:hypothetical protein
LLKNKYLHRLSLALCGAFALLFATLASAEVARVDITKREDLLNGRSYGAAVAYEWLEGRAHFALDPANPRNDIIVDLKLAPRNAKGLVEFSADIGIVRPKSAASASGVVILDVVNRGRPTVFEFLNRGLRSTAPASETFIGDDFLLKQGVTIVWLGWQQDLPALRGLARLDGPVVQGVEGRVYGEFTVDERVTDMSLGDRTSIPYAVASMSDTDNTLAISPSRSVAPRPIPQHNWAYASMQNGVLMPDPLRLHVEAGFVPGAIYQFAYGTQNPRIAGLGLAGVRDLMSWIRHDPAALVNGKTLYGFGISQSGRFLRQFVHEGFNEDTAGRRVFDGLMVHIAGGARRGFNERFAQPSRTTGSRVFPFTDIDQTDKETGETGGILSRATRAGVVPKIFYTSSSWEYWGSGASTIHTTLAGEDVVVPDSSRIYHFASTQHEPARAPFVSAASTASTNTLARRGQLPHNPLDYRPGLRALYVAFDQWVRNGTPPPPSRYPREDERALAQRTALRVAGLRSIAVPEAIQPVFRLDNGEKVPGIPTIVPPRVGKPYALLVPQVDEDGNELAGIRMPALAAPLATYTGWNLRAPETGAPRELVQLVGGMLPFARTRDERRPGDARAAIVDRYPSRAGYLSRIAEEAAVLAGQRLLLKEDVPRILEEAGAMWDILMAGQAASPKPKP